MANTASRFSASTPPDSMTLALLLRQLDIIDLKRLSAARQQFEESHRGLQTSRSMSGSGSGRFRFATDQALMEENLTKNRYSNIVSCESKSRFREHIKADVRGIGVDDQALLPSPYLNASLIPSPSPSSSSSPTSTSTSHSPNLPIYISAQAPLPSTFPTFFRHLISQKVKLVVMLTPLIESGRRKAQQYWPEEVGDDHRLDLGEDYKIQLISQSLEKDDEKGWECWFRSLRIIKTEATYDFDQIHVTSWEDHGSSSQESLVRILDLIDPYTYSDSSSDLIKASNGHRDDRSGLKSVGNGSGNGTHSGPNDSNGSDNSTNGTNDSKFNPSMPNSSPILVHCSAGVGRSGTVISSHMLRHLIRSEVPTDSILSRISSFTRGDSSKTIESISDEHQHHDKHQDEDEDEGEDEGLREFSNQLPYQIVKWIRFYRPRMVQTHAQLEMVWKSCLDEQESKAKKDQKQGRGR